jgi:hypothetical protein
MQYLSSPLELHEKAELKSKVSAYRSYSCNITAWLNSRKTFLWYGMRRGQDWTGQDRNGAGLGSILQALDGGSLNFFFVLKF